jgi:hypothetical protein
MYNLSTNYDTISFKPFDCQEKVKEFLTLLNHPEVQAFLKLFMENSIITSDLQILQRLTTLEDSISSPQINEQIKIEQMSIPTTRTEQRACKVAERMKGKRFLNSSEIVGYLRSGIDEHLRIKEGQNARQIKKEVLNKVIQLFPNMSLDKKKQGRREVRLIAVT